MSPRDGDEMGIPMIQPSRSSAHRTVSSISSMGRSIFTKDEESFVSPNLPAHGFPYNRIDSTNIEQPDRFELPAKEEDPMVINKIFMGLSFYCLVMIFINLLDIALMPQISKADNSYVILNAPPAIATFAAALGVAFYIWRQWSTLRALATTTSKRRRSAWFSVVLTMLLPVLFCQFGYINLIAFPRFETIVWDYSVDYRDQIMPPVLTFEIDRSRTMNMNFKDLNCSIHTGINERHSCIDNLSSGTYDDYWWVMYNPKEPREPLGQGDYIWITLPFSFTDYDPYKMDVLSVYAFDPSYMDEAKKGALRNMEWSCNFWATAILDLAGRNVLEFDRKEFTDPEFAAVSDSDDCDFSTPRTNLSDTTTISDYAIYDMTSNHFKYDDAEGCYPSSTENTTDCYSDIRAHFKTNMVSHQTSRRDIDWVKILTDESGWAGGIVFFTWFLSIYIV